MAIDQYTTGQQYARPQQTVSNRLRQGAQSQRSPAGMMVQQQPQQRTNPYGNAPQSLPYGQGMTRQQQPQTYNQNVGGGDMYRIDQVMPSAMGQQPSRQWDQYSMSQARGGGLPIDNRPYMPDPLPGQQVPSKDGTGQQTYYNPTIPQYMPAAPSPQVTANQFSYYQGLDPTTLQSNDEREAALQAVQANVPIWQMQQNAYQYAQDANTANQRWDQQFNYQQGLDQFNMGLAGQQQAMAEWQAQQGAQQWAQDFNRQSSNDAWQQQFSQQQFGLQDYATREGLTQQAAANAQLAAYQTGQLGLGNRQADIQQQLGLGNLDVQRQANDIDQMYKTGQLDLGQRNAALAELSQAQNYGLAQQQQSMQQQELARRFGLDEQTQRTLEIYRQQQLAQEAELTRAQIAAQQQMANVAAFGRNQAPNVRWLRAG